jgi:hypothetical protein
MGRGRQKAKHTKVARELKYFSPDTNYGALEKELGVPSSRADEWPEYEDTYGDAEESGEVETDLDEDIPQNKSA